MSAELLADVTVVALEADTAGSISYASACAAAEARPLGPDDAVEKAGNRVEVLGAHASRPARPAGLGPLLATIAGEGVAL